MLSIHDHDALNYDAISDYDAVVYGSEQVQRADAWHMSLHDTLTLHDLDTFLSHTSNADEERYIQAYMQVRRTEG